MTPTELRQFWSSLGGFVPWPDAQVVTFSTETEPEADAKSARSVHELDAPTTSSEPEVSAK
jgi:hypothetical protein